MARGRGGRVRRGRGRGQAKYVNPKSGVAAVGVRRSRRGQTPEFVPVESVPVSRKRGRGGKNGDEKPGVKKAKQNGGAKGKTKIGLNKPGTGEDEKRQFPIEESPPRQSAVQKAVSARDAIALREALTLELPPCEDVRADFLACIATRDLDCVQAFMDAPFRPNLNLLRDETYPIIQAVEWKNAALVRVLLSRPLDLKYQKLVRDSNEKSPVLIATENNEIEILKILLEGGWDPNLGTHYGKYPLHTAIQYKNKDMVELLLKHQANATLQTSDFYGKQSALMVAVGQCGRDGHPKGRTYKKEREMVQFILNTLTPLDMRQQDVAGNSALDRYAGGDPQVLEWLLDKGAGSTILGSTPDRDHL